VRSLARTPGLALALVFTIAIGIGSNVTIDGFVRGLLTRGSPLIHQEFLSVFARDAQGRPGPLTHEQYVALRAEAAFSWIGAARVTQTTFDLGGGEETLAAAAVTPELAELLMLPVHQGVVVSHALGERRGKASGVAGVAPEWLDGLYAGRPIDLWIALGEGGGRNYWVLAKGAPARLPDGIVAVPYTGFTPDTAEGVGRVGAALSLAAGAVFFIACANVASFVLGRSSARGRETSLRVALGASRGQLARGLLADTIAISTAGGAAGLLLAVWTSRLLPALLFDQDAQRLVYAPDFARIAAVCAACVAMTLLCGFLPALAMPHKRPGEILRRESAGPSKGIRRLRTGLVVAQMASCCALAVSTAVLFGGLRAAMQTAAGQRLGKPILAGVHAHPGWGLRYFREVERAARAMPGVAWVEWSGRPPGGQPTWLSFRIEAPGLPLRNVPLDVAWIDADSLDLFHLPPRAGRLFGIGDRGRRVAIVNEAAADALFGAETVGRTVEDEGRAAVEIIGVVATRRASRPAIYYYDDTRPRTAGQSTFRAHVPSKLDRVELEANVVSPGYFIVMSFALLKGRLFSDSGAIVNREAADLYFGGNAVGAAVIDDRGRRATIEGVVETSLLGTFQRRADPAIYFPMSQDWLPRMTMIAGARESDERAVAELLRRVEAVPGRAGSPILVKSLEQHLSQTAFAPLRIATLLIGACAAAGLALGILGLYGAMSDAALQRRRESAVRIALGAQRRHVVGQVLREGGRLAAAGAAVGTGASIMLARSLAAIAPGGAAPPLWVWLAAPAALAVAVAVASVLPARGALMANPVEALREER
jgi:hypothetical protein